MIDYFWNNNYVLSWKAVYFVLSVFFKLNSYWLRLDILTLFYYMVADNIDFAAYLVLFYPVAVRSFPFNKLIYDYFYLTWF